MRRLAQLTGVRVNAKTSRAIAGDTRCAHISGASTNRSKRLRDPASNELVVAWRLRALPPLDLSLALITRVTPGLLSRQQFGEHMRLLPSTRQALVALTPMTRLPISAVQLHPRAHVLSPRTTHPRCADPRHKPRLANQTDDLSPTRCERGARASRSGAWGRPRVRPGRRRWWWSSPMPPRLKAFGGQGPGARPGAPPRGRRAAARSARDGGRCPPRRSPGPPSQALRPPSA